MDEYGPESPNTDPDFNRDSPDVDAFDWEDPPLRGGGGSGVWKERLGVVMTQPGKWARLVECSGTRRAEMHCGNLRAGKIKVPEGRWEFQSRSDKTVGKSWVYARYLGPEEAEGATSSGRSRETHGPDRDLSGRVLWEDESSGQSNLAHDSGPETQDGGHHSPEAMDASEQTG